MYEMKRRKGDGYVTQTYELNRLDYIILDTLYDGGFKDYYHAITIKESKKQNIRISWYFEQCLHNKAGKFSQDGG